MKGLVGAFNQEKALVGDYKTSGNLREGSLEALVRARPLASVILFSIQSPD